MQSIPHSTPTFENLKLYANAINMKTLNVGGVEIDVEKFIAEIKKEKFTQWINLNY